MSPSTEGPFCIGVEVQIPVVYARYMDAVSVEFYHVHMVAAVAVSLLVLEHDEEHIRRYGVGSWHNGAQRY